MDFVPQCVIIVPKNRLLQWQHAIHFEKNILHNVSKLCLTIYIFWNVTTESAIDAQISLYINEKKQRLNICYQQQKLK